VIGTPYPPITRWLVPSALLPMTVRGLQDTGQRVRESGALWLGERATTARITAVVFPHGNGVEEGPSRWKVSPEVFGTVTRWGKPRGLCLLAVVHTHLHGIPARLSRADREYSVQIPDMLAVVIGEGGAELDARRWGWYLYDKHDYRQLLARELDERFVPENKEGLTVRRADADGVWELTK
jgi:hypothetical protein